MSGFLKSRFGKWRGKRKVQEGQLKILPTFIEGNYPKNLS